MYKRQVNTCTVTNIADRKSRQMLHRAKKQNPQAIIVAAGCYAQASKEECETDKAIDLIIGNNKKKDIVQIIENFKQKRQVPETVIAINDTKEYEDMPITRLENHTRAILKIQDGCNQFCTYCMIPYVRGRVRSRQLDSILEEAAVLAEQGYKEIVLTGIHLSSYGADWKDGETKTLLSVLLQLHKIPKVERIRLGSLEPRIITEEFVTAICRLPKVCPHFHLSLQSGCDSVLKRMHRFYSTKEYLEKCTLLRNYYKNPAITTDIIVGFPGETEEEFLCTEKFLETVSFFEMHIFKYSKRFGTKAALMPNQVTEQVKAERSSRLLQLEKNLSNRYREQWIGQETEVLIEEIISLDGFFCWIGHTMEYIKVAIKIMDEFGVEEEKRKAADKKVGQIVRVKVTGKILEDTLFGIID